MHYFVDEADQPGERKIPNFYTQTRFTIEEITVRFEEGGKIDGVIGRLMNCLVNRSFDSMAFWERRIPWIIKAAEIRYRLRPKKGLNYTSTDPIGQLPILPKRLSGQIQFSKDDS